MDDVVKNIVERAKQRREIIERAKRRAGPVGAATAFGLGAADAITLGWGDEAAGLGGMTASYLRFLQSPLYDEIKKAEEAGDYQRAQTLWRMAQEEMRRDYEIARDEVRQTQELYQKAHPYAHFAGEIAGTAPYAAAAGQLLGVINPAGTSMAAKMGTEALFAGIQSAIYGAGSAREGNRLNQAIETGAFGAGIGAAAPVVRLGARKGVEKLAEFWKRPKIDWSKFPRISRKSVRQVLNTIVRNEPIEEVQANARLAGKELGTLMDASPAAARMAKGVYQSGGTPANRIYHFLTTRKKGAYGRVVKALNEILGRPRSTEIAKRELARKAYARARPYYAIAEKHNVPLETIADILERPAVRSALRKATRLAADEGVHLDKETIEIVNKLLRGKEADIASAAVPEKVIDYIQRALYDRIKKVGPNEARILSNVRDELLRRVDAQIPAFKTARKLAKTKFDFEEVIDLGKEIFSKKHAPEDIAAAVKAMTPEEREAMKIGIRAAMRDAIDYVRNPLPATKGLYFSQAPAQRQKLIAALGRKARPLMEAIDREALFRDVRNMVVQGSHTAQNVSSPLHPLQHITLWQSVQNMLAKVAALGNKVSREELADELSRILTDTGPMRDEILLNLAEMLKSKEVARALGQKTANWLRQWANAQLAAPVIKERMRHEL